MSVAENGKGGARRKSSTLFFCRNRSGKNPPPTQLCPCCSCTTGGKELCKWEAEISCSKGNNQFPFPWHRKSRHQPTPHSLRLALPTGFSWLQTKIQFGLKTSSSLLIHPVGGLQNRNFTCINESPFPLISAKG